MARMVKEQQLTFARGMNDTAAPIEYQDDECELLYNGRVSFDGQTVQRRGGSEKTHASALNSGGDGYGGIEYYTAAGQQQLVVFMGDKMYYSTDEGATWTNATGATSLTESFWSLVIMREGAANVLCCANGGTNSYQWNGTTWATISNIPNSVKYLAVHGNRLWASGHSGIDVVASKVGDIDTWSTPDGLTVKAQTHDGDPKITGLFQLGSVLMVFKSESTGYIEGYGFTTLEVEAGSRGISRSVGCMAPRSIQAVGDQGVCWLSKRGLEHYQMGGVITPVSRSIQKFIDGVNWSQIRSTPSSTTALWWPQKHEYWCSLPVSSSSNDYMIGYRPPTEERPPALMLHRYAATEDDTLFIDGDSYLDLSTTSDRDQGDTLFGYLITSLTGGQLMAIDSNGHLAFATALHNDATLFIAEISGAEMTTTPMSCGYDGFVRQLEKGDADNQAPGGTGGVSISFKLITRPFFFGQPMRDKRARIVRVASQQRNASTVTVKVKADGVDGTAHSITYAIASKPVVKKVRVGTKGNAQSVELTSTDDVKIGSIELAAAVFEEAW